MFLVAGLGNPGADYADNRHNIGFLVADMLALRWRVGAFKQKFGAAVGQGQFGDEKVVLVKPQEFMNASGPPIQRVAAFFHVDVHQIVVIHDDIDLDFGRIKVKVGGGHGGHNGLRSLAEGLGPAFVRVRCGVGHPGHKERVVGHVLSPFSKVENKEVPFIINGAVDAVESIIRDGVVPTMNKFNVGPPQGGEAAPRS